MSIVCFVCPKMFIVTANARFVIVQLNRRLTLAFAERAFPLNCIIICDVHVMYKEITPLTKLIGELSGMFECRCVCVRLIELKICEYVFVCLCVRVMLVVRFDVQDRLFELCCERVCVVLSASICVNMRGHTRMPRRFVI